MQFRKMGDAVPENGRCATIPPIVPPVALIFLGVALFAAVSLWACHWVRSCSSGRTGSRPGVGVRTALMRQPEPTGFPWAVLLVVCLSAVGGIGLPPASAATISFVQVNAATPQTSQTTVAVTYLAAQAGGNLNIVVVGWNDA